MRVGSFTCTFPEGATGLTIDVLTVIQIRTENTLQRSTFVIEKVELQTASQTSWTECAEESESRSRTVAQFREGSVQ